MDVLKALLANIMAAVIAYFAGGVSQKNKQLKTELKDIQDAVKKSDEIDKELAHYDDDAVDRVLDSNKWLRPSNDN
jgi:hypothetical protein